MVTYKRLHQRQQKNENNIIQNFLNRNNLPQIKVYTVPVVVNMACQSKTDPIDIMLGAPLRQIISSSKLNTTKSILNISLLFSFIDKQNSPGVYKLQNIFEYTGCPKLNL